MRHYNSLSSLLPWPLFFSAICSLEVVAEDGDPTWEKSPGPNMIDIHSMEQFIHALSEAGNKLMFVKFYGTWCASCRALYPRVQKIKDAIALHNTDGCSIGPPVSVGDIDLFGAPTKEKSVDAASR